MNFYDIADASSRNQIEYEVDFLRGQVEALKAMLGYLTEKYGNGKIIVPPDYAVQISAHHFELTPIAADGYSLKVSSDCRKIRHMEEEIHV